MIASFLLVGDQPYAEMMVKSVKEVHGCKIVQMSDLKTPKVNGVDEVVRLPFRIPLMLYRLRHLASYPHHEMLILDTDVICKRPIPEILNTPFDIMATMRETGELYNGDGQDIAAGMPFNTGVMVSRSNGFWSECYNWLATQEPELQRWYGDQRAVFTVVGRGHYDVLVTACNEYNWAPSNEFEVSDASFWHYKGAKRKTWINSKYSSDLIDARLSPITSAVSR